MTKKIANTNGLEMKYFVLKPKGRGPYAIASREAMRTYAEEIKKENPKLARDLNKWAMQEIQNTAP